jgi:N-acetylglucosaminyl-diphospho-decaprenol L-rhamnosyltransferase
MTDSQISSSTLATVIVNFRTADLTLRAVEALLSEIDGVDGEVYVVDNDSGDESFERLSEAVESRQWSGRVSVLRSDHNGGFGYGVNAGVRRALQSPRPPRYIYVLISDGFPNRKRGARAHCGSRSTTRDRDRRKRSSSDRRRTPRRGFRFPTLFSEFEGTINLGPVSRLLRRWIVSRPPPAESREVDWVSGTSFMVRREVFDTVGLFDDGFFLYFEEIDFCKRARNRGFKSVFVPQSSVQHIGAVSTQMERNDRPMPEYWFASRRRYFTKHHGPTYAAVCDALWITGFSVARVRLKLRGRTDDAKPHMLRDFIKFNVPRSLGLRS